MKKRNHRILSALLALVMVFSLIPAASAYTGVASWAQEEVSAMDDLGLIPDSLQDADLSQNINRLDMCRIAVLAYEKVTGTTIQQPSEHPFTDTTDPDAEKAYAVGLVKGYDDGTFGPEKNLIRLEFFCFVGQFLEAVNYRTRSSDYADLSGFSDGSSIPSWGKKYTQLTVGLGIVKGTGTSLNYKANTSAQEALMMFYRTYNVVESAHEFINLASWAEEAVYAMDDWGLIPEEVRNSAMDGTITRLNMCKIVMLAFKELMGISDADLGTPGDPFTDTDDLDVRNAYRLGIVSGKGDGKFCPNEPISRQDFFKISVNFLNAIEYLYDDDETVDLSVYSDYKNISDYAVGPTRLLISIGAVKGTTEGTLRPKASIVCQEALVIFYRIHNFVTTWVASDAEDNRSQISRDEANSVVDYAMQYLGYDYVYGGKSPEDGFDCSGFVYYVYKHFGYTLNPGATNQWNTLSDTVIPRADLLPGDLVFFSSNGEVSGMTHVAIYIGDGQIIHANTPSTGVIISDLNEPYYVRMYLGSKRVIE